MLCAKDRCYCFDFEADMRVHNYNSKDLFPMMRLLLEEMNTNPTSSLNIINSFKSPTFNPFHIDCKYTKKKLCQCPMDPIINLQAQQKRQLAQQFQPIKEFYSKPKELSSSEIQIKQKLIEKIRNLDLADLKVFLNRKDTVNE